MRLQKHIEEATYQGNIGFEELAKFYSIASEEQKKKMENILEKGNWAKFRELIKQVLGVVLK